MPWYSFFTSFFNEQEKSILVLGCGKKPLCREDCCKHHTPDTSLTIDISAGREPDIQGDAADKQTLLQLGQRTFDYIILERLPFIGKELNYEVLVSLYAAFLNDRGCFIISGWLHPRFLLEVQNYTLIATEDPNITFLSKCRLDEQRALIERNPSIKGYLTALDVNLDMLFEVTYHQHAIPTNLFKSLVECDSRQIRALSNHLRMLTPNEQIFFYQLLHAASTDQYHKTIHDNLDVIRVLLATTELTTTQQSAFIKYLKSGTTSSIETVNQALCGLSFSYLFRKKRLPKELFTVLLQTFAYALHKHPELTIQFQEDSMEKGLDDTATQLSSLS